MDLVGYPTFGAGRRQPAVTAPETHQFLIEAVLLCNVGGVFGVLASFGLGNAVTLFTDFEADVPLEWVVFCTVVGLSFGLWPALKASKLNLIDALRWE